MLEIDTYPMSLFLYLTKFLTSMGYHKLHKRTKSPPNATIMVQATLSTENITHAKLTNLNAQTSQELCKNEYPHR